MLSTQILNVLVQLIKSTKNECERELLVALADAITEDDRLLKQKLQECMNCLHREHCRAYRQFLKLMSEVLTCIHLFIKNI